MYLSWLGLLKVTNVMQDSLVHSSGMRVKSVSSSAVLSFCRDALGSFDKWLRAAAISITTFFCPPPSGFQVVGFSFWDFPNKWGGWRPRKTNNKASEILTPDSNMRKLRSQAIACKMTVVNRPPIMLKYNFSCSFLWSKNWFIQDIRVLKKMSIIEVLLCLQFIFGGFVLFVFVINTWWGGDVSIIQRW